MPSELSKATAHLVVRPPSFKVTIGETDYLIKPLPADEVDLIADAMTQIISSLQVVIGVLPEMDVEAIKRGDPAQLAALIPLVPMLIKSLSHSVPKVIAAAIRMDEQFVEDNIFSDDRIDILHMVFETEGTKHLLGKLIGLASETIPKKADPEIQPSTQPEPTPQSPDITPAIGSTKLGKGSRSSKSTG